MFANFQSANPNKDFELPDVQEDGLSKIKFSPNANYLAACSWDNSVCVVCVYVRVCVCVQEGKEQAVVRVWQVGVSCK